MQWWFKNKDKCIRNSILKINTVSFAAFSFNYKMRLILSAVLVSSLFWACQIVFLIFWNMTLSLDIRDSKFDNDNVWSHYSTSNIYKDILSLKMNEYRWASIDKIIPFMGLMVFTLILLIKMKFYLWYLETYLSSMTN